MNNIMDEYSNDTEFSDISYMIKAISILELLPVAYRNSENNDIIKRMKEYLYTYCRHQWEEDYIDISLDQSVKIHYCRRCQSNYKDI